MNDIRFDYLGRNWATYYSRNTIENHNELGTHIWHQNKDPSHSPVVVECTIPPFERILWLHKQKGKKNERSFQGLESTAGIESWDCQAEVMSPLCRFIVAFTHFILIYPKHVDILWLFVNILEWVGAWQTYECLERRSKKVKDKIRGFICHLYTLQ